MYLPGLLARYTYFTKKSARLLLSAREQIVPKQSKTVEQLLIDLRQNDWSVNWKTADALAEIGENALPRLLKALEDTDGYARNGAAIALGKIGNKRRNPTAY